MAFTKIETGGISTTAQITLTTVNISGVSTLGVVSATNLNVSSASTLNSVSATNLNVSSASTISNVTISSGSVVGTAGTLIAGVGIQSAGVSIATTAKTLNFIGAGNTFNVVGDRVDISIQGGGGGSGVSSTGILTCRGFANSSKITESILMNDFYNQGTNYGMLGPIEVSVGATVTVGLGVSYVIL